MKRLLMPAKKFLCVLLICFSMTGVVVSDYAGSVKAYGAELALSALYTALMESIMLYTGYTYSSESDLAAGGNALGSLVQSAAEYIADGFTSYNDLSTEARAQTTLWAFELALQLQGVDSYGDSVALSAEAYNGICDWARSMSIDQAVEGVYTSSVAGNKSVKLVDDITPSIFLQFMKDLYPALDISNAESVAAAELIGNYPFIAVSESYSPQNVLQIAYIYFCSAECLYYTDKGINYGNSNYSNLNFYYSLTYPAFDNTYGAVPYIKSSKYYSYFNVSDCYILMEKSVPIYSSYADYIARINSSVYAPASIVYGSSDLAKDPAESEDGTISIPIVEPYITQQVVSAVTDAIAENPDATDEDINAKIVELIAAINDVKDTTGDIAEDTGTIIGLLTSVLANLKTMGQSVDKLVELISIDGGAGLLDWSDVQDAFAEEEVEVATGGASDNDNDDDNDEKHGIAPWIPAGAIVTVGFLAPLVKFLTDPLSNITQYLDAVEEWIMDIPETLDSAISTPIQDVIEAVQELASDIVLGLSEAFEMPIQDVIEAVQELASDIVLGLSEALDLDVFNPIDEILEILNDLVVIDTAQIMDALGVYSVAWEEKLSFLNRLASIFDYTFPTEYKYPIIQIKTPSILITNEFYDQEYIVLCDFADFKTQCLWARGLAKAVLWIGFAFSVFKQFKVNLHIG